ncbi:hypothetical protein LSAT2_017417, partial [Lamellibrachia satsuma]
MTPLQKLLALLISLSIAVMVFYGGYILKTKKSNMFLTYHDRPNNAVHEPLKPDDRPKDAIHEPLKPDNRPNDAIHYPVKHDDRPNDAIHEPLKHDYRLNDAIHEPLKHDYRPNDATHEPLKHDYRPNDAIYDPLKQDYRPNDAIHEPLKHDYRPNDAIHEPLKHDYHPNDATHEPLKHDYHPNNATHKPLKHDYHPIDAIHYPLKHDDHRNDAIHEPMKHNDRPNDVIHEPQKHDDRLNDKIHQPLKQNGPPNDVIHELLKHVGRWKDTNRESLKHSENGHKYRLANGGNNTNTYALSYKSGELNNYTHAQITFRTSSLSEPVQHVAPSIVPTSPPVVPTMPTVCTYSGRNVVTVNTTGDFLRRLQAYNDAIGKLRREILTARPLVAQWKPIGAKLAVLWGNKDDFMQCLSWRDEVITVALAWAPSDRNRKWTSRLDRRNVLVQDYYEWTASEPLCTWIRQKGFTKARWDAVYNRTCNTDAARSVAPTSLEPVYFHGKPINVRDYWPNSGDAYPTRFYSRLPEHVFYIHLTCDAVITEPGDIISGSLKFLPYACSQDTTATPPRGYDKTVVYGEVFIMTQFWGGEHFHKMLEGFPRIAPYLAFLHAHEHVLIHAAETGGYTAATLRFLGLNPERLVTGLCRAKVVYMPQATPCGFAHAQSTQLLSKLYRDRIGRRNATRNTLVLIERSGTRRFTRARAIQAALMSVANETSLALELYPDRPPPPIEASMRTFAGAVVVVAPHGAGLANLVYAPPGTYVVEAVCNPPHVNMCYQWAAHVLGMRYHALPSRHGCESVIDVDVDEIADVVRTYARRAAAELRVRVRGNS